MLPFWPLAEACVSDPARVRRIHFPEPRAPDGVVPGSSVSSNPDPPLGADQTARLDGTEPSTDSGRETTSLPANSEECRRSRLAARDATGSAIPCGTVVRINSWRPGCSGHRSLIRTDGLEGAVLGGGVTHTRRGREDAQAPTTCLRIAHG